MAMPILACRCQDCLGSSGALSVSVREISEYRGAGQIDLHLLAVAASHQGAGRRAHPSPSLRQAAALQRAPNVRCQDSKMRTNAKFSRKEQVNNVCVDAIDCTAAGQTAAPGCCEPIARRIALKAFSGPRTQNKGSTFFVDNLRGHSQHSTWPPSTAVGAPWRHMMTRRHMYLF